MTDLHAFTDLVDDAALFSLEHQIHLSDVVGDHSWQVTLSEPSFVFTGSPSRTCTAMHLVGSAAPGPQTWLWAWANPSGFHPDAVALSATVRSFGQRHGIDLLTEPEIPFGALPSSPTEANLVAGMMIEATKTLTEKFTSYTGDAGGGTRAAFLVEHPDFLLPPPDPARTMRIINQGLADLLIHNHRRALYSYAVRRGMSAVFTDDRFELDITGDRFFAQIRFRDDGRVDSIDGKLG